MDYKFSSPFSSFDFLTISYWWQLPVGRWLYDNPHTQYTLHIDIEKRRRRRRCVYDWRGFKIYDWRRRLSHMQMTDFDFTLNDWRRRLGGGGAGHYWLGVSPALLGGSVVDLLKTFHCQLEPCWRRGDATYAGGDIKVMRRRRSGWTSDWHRVCITRLVAREKRALLCHGVVCGRVKWSSVNKMYILCKYFAYNGNCKGYP